VSKVPQFTAHNIVLPDGTMTIPGKPVLAESDQAKAALRALDLIFPADARVGKRIIDLGCLEGGYTVEFARAGFDSLGIEVRDVNIAKCNYVATALGLPNLRFAQDDVRNVERYGQFDAIFCSGLLYHLDRPTEYLHTLAKVTTRALILQTHYATRRRPPRWRTYPPYRISRLVRHEGNLGRWVHEYSPRAKQEKVEGAVWASFGNPRSFWIEKKHLLQTLREVGFPLVFEQYDFLTNIVADRYIHDNHRSLFVAVRPVGDRMPR